MSGPPAGALREAVLAGKFWGKSAAASELAGFVASADARLHLQAWFGPDWLAWLWAQPDRLGALRAAIDRDIARLDALISAQLDAVLRHPRLQRLEGSWRGLAWLVDRLPQGKGHVVRLKMFQARWVEICRDIDRAIEFDQSQLFRKIHEEQFGMAGGEPFGLIACDYEIRHRPGALHPTDDISALSGLAGIAAAAFSPMIFSAAPELLGVESFSAITPGFDPARMLQGADHQRWRQAATQEDLRFIGIALPRVLARPAWPDDGCRVDRFRYRGYMPEATDRVWTSPVYGFAAAAVRAFDRYAWPAEVRGADILAEARGGVLEDLPFERFFSDVPAEAPARAPLEVAFTDEQENQISDAGLIPLAALDGLSEACFGALPSLHRPPRMTTAVAQANQRISAQINSILCVSRFAHCVKMMGRDMVGSFLDPKDVESRLQRWLNGFVSGGGLSSVESTAKYPLLAARVEVRERESRPGVYNCTVHLQPHHQLDDIGATFRLVTEFSPRNATA
jgi:type VI secretion system protein ImpD/type VI secretion system protein ImpC